MNNRMHIGHRHGDIPQEELERLEHALRETGDQWEMALCFAADHVGDQDPHLTTSIRHDIAIAMMARLAMNLRRKLRVFSGWDILDMDNVVTTFHEGFVYANGITIDDGDTAVLVAPEESLDANSNERWVVVRYSKVWRAEVDWAPHGYEDTVAVHVTENPDWSN